MCCLSLLEPPALPKELANKWFKVIALSRVLVPSQGSKTEPLTASSFKDGKALVGWGNLEFLVRDRSPKGQDPSTNFILVKWRGQDGAESEAGKR